MDAAAEADRVRRIGRALERVRAACDVGRRLAEDPVGFVRRYDRAEDRELVGLLCSAAAFGNVKAVRAKIEDALRRIGPDVAGAARATPLDAIERDLRGWRHRVYLGEDVARLLAGARGVQRRHGSLGARLAEDLRRRGDLREALGDWTRAIRSAGGLGRGRRGESHILADPAGASGCKRLLLYLRWMARPDDGVDLGMWDVPTSRLLVPLDVHVHRLARNLGLTSRGTPSWRATEEITAAMRRWDADDPTRYDFALCHLGMSLRCPSRRDPVRCDGCKIRPVCVHWRSRACTDRAAAQKTSRPRARRRARARTRARARARHGVATNGSVGDRRSPELPAPAGASFRRRSPARRPDPTRPRRLRSIRPRRRRPRTGRTSSRCLRRGSRRNTRSRSTCTARRSTRTDPSTGTSARSRCPCRTPRCTSSRTRLRLESPSGEGSSSSSVRSVCGSLRGVTG